jgi:hypothetical protein
MIEVIDNALPESIINKLSQKVVDKTFPWYIGDDIDKSKINNENLAPGICIDKNTIPTFQFYHKLYRIFDTPKINSSLFNFFNNPILDFLESKKIGGQLYKSKLNLLTNLHNLKSNNLYNVPHIDVSLPHLSILLYLNNSDGDTTFFNERYKDDEIRPKSLSIKKTVSPKINRMVISDGYYHTSSNPINTDYRIVFNTVLLT